MKAIAAPILFFNFCICIVIFGIGGWVMNHTMDNGFVIGAGFEVPQYFSPIFFQIGNSATGFFVIFALIAAVAVVASAISGSFYFRFSDSSNLPPAASTALIACFLTFLAMGFAWKEIALTVTSGHLVRNLKASVVFLSFLFPFSKPCFSSPKCFTE
ncbi:uncharacterized protein LOC120073380 isoform X1 [Benincasa hispida]|uniref:uncharacterized protein LOC120073380 isoform X1 n=1 Tax=Benincasa hispida TaxID=102211 RepID=UPI001900A3DC|nr:uncharacterized protein LOC120073380 isoform X1 [Benincasa hispida]